MKRTLLLVSICLGCSLTLHAGFVIEPKLGSEIVGTDTGSIVFKGTADTLLHDTILAESNQDLTGPIGFNSINLQVDLSGDLDGESIMITATELLLPSGAFFAQLGTATQTVADGGTVTWVYSAGNDKITFKEAFMDGPMVDLWRFDISATDFFEKDVDLSQIDLTVVTGDEDSPTALDSIGDPALTMCTHQACADPDLFRLPPGSVGTLTTAVPEPSSFLFVSMLVVLVTGVRRLRYTQD